MKHIRSLKLLIAGTLLISGMFLSLAISPLMISKVQAEIPAGCPGSTVAGPVQNPQDCPVCYQRQPANYVEPNSPIVTVVKDCAGDPNFITILQNVRGHAMDAKKCYIIQAGIHGITNGDDFGSQTCNEAEAARVDKGNATNPDGTPKPGPSGGSTTAAAQTGNAPAAQNSEQKTAAGPAVTKEEREGGFEDTDTNCTTDNVSSCSVTDRLSDIADVLSVGVGIIIVIMIIVGGIQYSMAGGDPGKVAGAKSKILNAIYALIAYFFLFAFLQWVVPGGIF